MNFYFWWENKGVCVHRKWELGHGYIMPKCPGGISAWFPSLRSPGGVLSLRGFPAFHTRYYSLILIKIVLRYILFNRCVAEVCIFRLPEPYCTANFWKVFCKFNILTPAWNPSWVAWPTREGVSLYDLLLLLSAGRLSNTAWYTCLSSYLWNLNMQSIERMSF